MKLWYAHSINVELDIKNILVDIKKARYTKKSVALYLSEEIYDEFTKLSRQDFKLNPSAVMDAVLFEFMRRYHQYKKNK